MNELPIGFSERRPFASDRTGVLDLMNACSQAEIGLRNYSLESINQQWSDDDFHLDTDAWLVTDSADQIVGYADFYENTPPDPCEVTSWVRPDLIATGLGEYLLSCLDERAQQALARAPQSGAITLEHGWVYEQSTALRQRIEQFGYQHIRTWLRLQIEMAHPPDEPRLPAGIVIRPFRPGEDDRALYEAWEEAMADEWGHAALTYDKWRYYFIDRAGDEDVPHWFLAVEGDEIAGLVLGRWRRPGQEDEGHIRYLAVRPAWRRRGLGLALLLYSFGEFYRRGRYKVGLGVDGISLTGAERLYLKAGMSIILRSLVYQKVLRAA
jgi:mycothiol synthase